VTRNGGPLRRVPIESAGPILVFAAARLAVAVVALLAVAYELLSLRFSRWRGAAFTAGCTALAAGLALPVTTFADHMAQHVLIGMVAPIGLVLGAPVTLLLQVLPVRAARRLTHRLRSRPARFLTHPVTALALTVGSLAMLYLTPLYARAGHHPALHAHFVLSGFLFAWVVAGADPAPHRPSVTARLVVLGVAIAAHATLAQLLYAGAYVQIPATAADRQAGATIMYYGGDLAELVLAFAVVQSRATTRRITGAVWPGRVTAWPGRVIS
jgi:putative membrane protein